jgi:hypothetical protein
LLCKKIAPLRGGLASILVNITWQGKNSEYCLPCYFRSTFD